MKKRIVSIFLILTIAAGMAFAIPTAAEETTKVWIEDFSDTTIFNPSTVYEGTAGRSTLNSVYAAKYPGTVFTFGVIRDTTVGSMTARTIDGKNMLVLTSGTINKGASIELNPVGFNTGDLQIDMRFKPTPFNTTNSRYDFIGVRKGDLSSTLWSFKFDGKAVVQDAKPAAEFVPEYTFDRAPSADEAGFLHISYLLSRASENDNWKCEIYDLNDTEDTSPFYACTFAKGKIDTSRFVLVNTYFANAADNNAETICDYIKVSQKPVATVTEDSAQNVAADADTISIKLNREVAGENAAATLVSGEGDNKVEIKTDLTWNNESKTFELKPKSYLEPGREYAVKFSGISGSGVKDFKFTTAAPKLTYSAPTTSYKVSGSAPTSDKPSEKCDVVLDMQFDNSCDGARNVLLLAAAYDAGGTLIKVGLTEESVAVGENIEKSVTIPDVMGSKVDSTRCFVWEDADGVLTKVPQK